MLAKMRNVRGDTIIEVMVALAILGLAFGISYAIANRSLQISQNSQEHSQALEYLDSQVELARSDVKGLYASTYVTNPGTTFCMTSSDVPTGIGAGDCHPSDGGADYNISISYNPSTDNDGVNQDIFTFTINWEGLGTLGEQQEQQSYKLHDINTTASIGGSLVTVGADGLSTPPPSPASVEVVVRSIRPNPGNDTPSCNEPASQNVAGSVVTLSSSGYSKTQTTDTSSTTTFSGLTGGNTYTANIGAPSQYQVCPPPSASTSTQPGNTAVINSIKIRPICYTTTTWNNYWQITGTDFGYNGYWRFGNTTPATAYTQSLTEWWGQTYTKSYPNYWYFVGTGSYYSTGGYTYEYYNVYDAVWHSDPVQQNHCP